MGSKRVFAFLLGLAGCVAFAGGAWADEFNVPSDYPSIQLAIDGVNNGDVILVEPGTWIECIRFNGKAITLRAVGGPDVTVLDGGQAGTVVSFDGGEGMDSVIDGFTITNGLEPFGGGVFCTYSSPTITNCIIRDNKSWFHGGGISLWQYCQAVITNCVIHDNAVTMFNGSGGGIACYGHSDVFVTNCTIVQNYAYYSGGGIDCFESVPIIRNSIIWDNTAPNGPQIYVDGPNPPNVRRSDVQGGWAGGGNIDADPLFANAAGNDFSLTHDTPCFNGGSNFSAYLPDWDIEGVARDYNGYPEMGAYEFPIESLFAPVTVISRAAGCAVDFTLIAGQFPPEYVNRMYFLLAGVSGNYPGFIIPGTDSKLALNWDGVGTYILHHYNNAMFKKFRDFLDANGQAVATLTIPGGWIPSGMIGSVMTFVYATEYPSDFVSSPFDMDIIP